MDVHAESLQQLLASVRVQTCPLPAIPALPALHRGDVIQIQGPASSGKTHLLYHILLAVLVPVADARPQIAAVVYDTDASFDILRFRRLLLSRIARLPSSARDSHETVRRALARLHVFRPTSLANLAASIADLSAYHSSHMPDHEIAVLAIDSISTFHWVDRFTAEQSRDALPLSHVFSAVQSVQHAHGSLVVLTNWALGPATSHSPSLYRQHLRPSPALDRASSPNHSTMTPLRLAHHIALLSDPSLAVLETRHQPGTVFCLLSSSGTCDTIRFAFQIADDDILVQPWLQ